MEIDTAKLRQEIDAKFEKARAALETATAEFEKAQDEHFDAIEYLDNIEIIAGATNDTEPKEIKQRHITTSGGTKVRSGKPILIRKRFWNGLREAIRILLNQSTEGITLRDVEEFIVRTYPHGPRFGRRKLSSALTKMRASGELRIVRNGFGATPAIYAKQEKEESETK